MDAQVFLKNIPHEEVVTLTSLVETAPGQVVSRTLVQNGKVGITLFAFSKGEEISTHDSSGDALVTVFEGTGQITIGDSTYDVSAGESIVMPAKIPHSLYAPEDFKMMLTVVFPHDAA